MYDADGGTGESTWVNEFPSSNNQHHIQDNNVKKFSVQRDIYFMLLQTLFDLPFSLKQTWIFHFLKDSAHIRLKSIHIWLLQYGNIFFI